MTTHYFTGPERNNTHIGMPPISTTDGVFLSLLVMGMVENYGFEAKAGGINSDGGGNIWVCRESLESKYTNDSVFHHPSPYLPWSALHIYWQGLVSRDDN